MSRTPLFRRFISVSPVIVALLAEGRIVAENWLVARQAGALAQAEPETRLVIQYAPHLAWGRDNVVEIVTTMKIINARSSATPGWAFYRFFDSQGEGATLTMTNLKSGFVIDGEGGDVSPIFDAALTLSAPTGTTGIHTGWIEIRFTESRQSASEPFIPDTYIGVGYEIRDQQSGAVLSSVEVDISEGRTSHVFSLWEIEGKPSTSIGFAVANPHNTEIEVLVTLKVPPFLTVPVSLQPFAQLSLFMNELFADHPEWESLLERTNGRIFSSVLVTAPLPVPIITLKTDNSVEGGFVLSGWSAFPGRQ